MSFSFLVAKAQLSRPISKEKIRLSAESALISIANSPVTQIGISSVILRFTSCPLI
jgi:hypothetical protein